MNRPTLGLRSAWWLNFSIVAATLATIPLIVLLEKGLDTPWLRAADWIVWAVFVAEYAIEITCAPSRSKYARRNWISPFVIIASFPPLPNLLAGARVLSLARISRFSRILGATFRGLTELRVVLVRRGLVYVAAATVLLILGGAAALEVVEPQTIHGGYFDGVWWAVVTASTVGYGDIAPSTLAGRLIAIVLMLAGIGMISTFSATITSYFVGQQEAVELREIRDRLVQIEAIMAELRDREQRPASGHTGEGAGTS